MTSLNTKYKLLEEILADLILEEQAKLGYRKESIRFYFPLSSLRHIFKNASNADEMQSLLADFLPLCRNTMVQSTSVIAWSASASSYQNRHPNMYICIKILMTSSCN